jgi:hypothetical protein
LDCVGSELHQLSAKLLTLKSSSTASRVGIDIHPETFSPPQTLLFGGWISMLTKSSRDSKWSSSVSAQI